VNLFGTLTSFQFRNENFFAISRNPAELSAFGGLTQRFTRLRRFAEKGHFRVLTSAQKEVCQMPIYEYQAVNSEASCPQCRQPFEVIQQISEAPLTVCPHCGVEVRKIISWCRTAVTERPAEDIRVEKEIKSYENAGMWSHAAELSDKHSEKTKDKNLKYRALDNYKRAGYDTDSLSKHAKLDDNE